MCYKSAIVIRFSTNFNSKLTLKVQQVKNVPQTNYITQQKLYIRLYKVSSGNSLGIRLSIYISS